MLRVSGGYRRDIKALDVSGDITCTEQIANYLGYSEEVVGERLSKFEDEIVSKPTGKENLVWVRRREYV